MWSIRRNRFTARHGGTVVRFSTVEELLEHEFFAWWNSRPEFLRYSFCGEPTNDGRAGCLMWEGAGGYEWWVLGYLDREPDLPAWKIPEDYDHETRRKRDAQDGPGVARPGS